jgi:hypothetical protein
VPSKTEDGAGAAAGITKLVWSTTNAASMISTERPSSHRNACHSQGSCGGEFQTFARNRGVVVLQIQTRPCAAPKRGYHAHTPIDQMRDAARQPDV